MTETRKKASEAVKKQAEAAETMAQSSAKAARKAAEGDVMPALDMSVPEAVRSLAEQTVARNRETYERSKDAMEETVETLETSLDKAGQGAAAFNRKMIDFTQANLNSSFDLAKDLATAKNWTEVVELQAAFARKQFGAISAQAEELRSLSTKVATEAVEPFRTHMSRSIDAVSRAS